MTPKLKLPWHSRALRDGSAASLCRIEMVLLIHSETGLLLHHVARRGAKFADPDQISGMLTAVRQFVAITFDDREDSLHEIRVADRLVCIATGPLAILAGVALAVEKPTDLELQLRDTLEQIHIEFRQELNAFSGDVAAFDRARALLNRHVRDDDKTWLTRAWFKRRSA